MGVVFAGVVSHAPGITGRAERADPALRDALYENFYRLGRELKESRPDALIVIAAEHFANFFMDNMPAYCMGMADYYEGPIEDEQWLGISRVRIPGNAALAGSLIESMLAEFDLAYAQEWKFDHGVMVPLHFLTPEYDIPVIPVNVNCQGPPLTPLARAYDFGRALRRACDARPERIAIIGTGGISHWPATPDSGKINEAWDRAFLESCFHGRGDLSRGRAGRVRDPHLHRRFGSHTRMCGGTLLLRADPDIRGGLHRSKGSRVTTCCRFALPVWP
jgi:2,3-dihydroxyphenylpropionate 1,2-dioxygenase